MESTRQGVPSTSLPFIREKSAVVIFIALLAARANAQTQNALPTFDVPAVESATTISGGVCSNQVIGVSYQLPEGMKPEDAAAMRMVAREGEMARTGIGPEAGYFLFGYQESKRAAMLCGAASKNGQVQVVASSVAALQQLGPNPLERIVKGMGQALDSHSSSAIQVNINGIQFERADAREVINAPGQGKLQLWGSFYAAKVNSYVVMWSLVGYSHEEGKQLAAGMNSVKISAPQPAAATVAPGTSTQSAARIPVSLDFQARLDAFLSAWLRERDQQKTMAFFDPAAFSAPPLIGSYCDGWYRKGASSKQAEQIISANLMGVPGDFPKNTASSAIFTAWDRLPPQWASESANDLTRDHFLVVRFDANSLSRIFSGIFADSSYEKYLAGEIAKRGAAYWVVFPEIAPDGDIFVIFTLWQKPDTTWNIIHVDIVCQ